MDTNLIANRDIFGGELKLNTVDRQLRAKLRMI